MALPSYQAQALNRTAMHFTMERETEAFLLDPPYQRTSVWSDEQRQNLIKRLIMGLSVGAVVTNDRHDYTGATYAVIDGRQRIETLKAFFADGFAVPAWWFEDRCLPEDLHGDTDATVTFSGLSITGRRFANNWKIAEEQHNRLTLAEEAELYLLVNFGGVPQDDADYARAAAVAEGGA
jgi:hypothetical protein